jgi:hypothetical protein
LHCDGGRVININGFINYYWRYNDYWWLNYNDVFIIVITITAKNEQATGQNGAKIFDLHGALLN